VAPAWHSSKKKIGLDFVRAISNTQHPSLASGFRPGGIYLALAAQVPAEQKTGCGGSGRTPKPQIPNNSTTQRAQGPARRKALRALEANPQLNCYRWY
jgi:hypothetical protein